MEELRRHICSRRGYRNHLRRLITRVTELSEQHNATPTTPLDSTTLTDLREQLQRKRDILLDLDQKISVLMESEEDLEREVNDAEEHHSLISTNIARVTQLLEACTAAVERPTVQTPPHHDEHTHPDAGSHHSAHVEDLPLVTAGDPPPTERISDTSRSREITRLPKLTIPTFSGNVLEWQSFWDCFETAVHNNPALSNVQKLNYLRAQLQEGALRVVAGLPLTNTSYAHSVTLLRDRYGQPHKLISAHMKALIELPGPSNTLASLQWFYDAIEAHTRSLASLGKPIDEYGAMLATSILGKLSVDTRWNLARAHGSDEWTITDLQHAISAEIRILETGVGNNRQAPQVATASFFTNTERRTPSQGRTLAQRPPTTCCVYCQGSHTPVNCDIVKEPQQRLELVKHNKLCFNCLGNHRVSQCKSKSRCRRCNRKHHTSLCTGAGNSATRNAPNATTETRNASNETPGSGLQTSTATTLTTLSSNQSTVIPHANRVCLLKTAVATISSTHSETETNILFDEGSQRSFLTRDLADTLSLQPSRKEDICISSFGAKPPLNQKMEVASINLKTKSGKLIPLSVLVVPDIAVPLKNVTNEKVTQLPHLKGLSLAHPVTTDKSFRISLLIGVDHYWDIVEDDIIRGDGPTAVGSKLGYLLSGPLPVTQPTTILHIADVTGVSCDIQKYWSLETTGTDPQADKGMNADQQFLETYSQRYITRLEDGSYCARFPWKDNHPPLPSNYKTCWQRTRSLARRLAQTPDLLKLYDGIITDQHCRGFIERVNTSMTVGNVHYIPHHCVKKNSATTPIRVVYDCSCRQSDCYPSLNDCLLRGPDFLNDLCSILLRFRTHAFAISTDIEKAFLHVYLHEKDRDFTRFFWLTDPSDPESELAVYRFKTVLFGAVSSPFILYATLYRHLQYHNTPLAKDIQENLYVDNIISGSATEFEAVQYYHNARSILSEAGFNLRAWTSNSQQVRAIAEQDKTIDASIPSNILEIHWNAVTDQLSLISKETDLMSELTTKREVLQESSRIFDPLGFATPITIRSKLLIQTLWKMKIAWDEPLEADLSREWLNIARDMNQLSGISIDRRYTSTDFDSTKAELHTFTDASTKAYGAVTFLSFNDRVSFVMAKSRVAPLKATTLPRLELMAAVIGARITKFIITSLKLEATKTYIWTDSQIVLYWIHSTKKLPQFIAHRIGEIHQLIPTAVWKYCPTNSNPADLPTRGVTFDQFTSLQLWRQGPQWLPHRDKWPEWKEAPTLHLCALAETVEEYIPKNNSGPPNTGLCYIIAITNYSTLHKLLAVTAYVHRFASNCLHHQKPQTGPLSSDELCKAKFKWVADCQGQVYWKEICNLSHSGSNHKRTMLVRQLRLFLDSEGFIRCGGRIHNAPLSQLARFPYLLPSRYSFTTLIIHDTHTRLYHCGVNSTITALRQTYWIPAIRQCVRNLLRHCTTCRRHIGKSYSPPDPAPLPKSRTQDVNPFTFTGVDFTGALYVRNGSEEVKAYVCLFTCATSRAVHLEVVTDLSTATFMLAFRRFVGRRSLPELMISDNATTYEAAADELKKLFSSEELHTALGIRGTTWKFIPKKAPWFGGFWERLIGLTKTTIKKILGRAHVSLLVLQTIVVEVELILNNRPLTYLSDDVRDPEPLTPSHILYGRMLTNLPHELVPQEHVQDPSYGEISRLNKAARFQSLLLTHFSTRWKQEYLTSLREFHRTSGSNNQTIKVGDVVLVHDDSPRISWKMAVVEELITGGDGLVRAANIRTCNGKTNRPIVKLYPLEITSPDEVTPSEPHQTENAIEDIHHVNDNAHTHPVRDTHPARDSARKARNKFTRWANELLAPPEDVEN